MWKGYLLVFLSATGFALIPIFALYAYDSGVTVTTLLFLRFAFAAVFFFIYLFVKVKRWNISKQNLLFLFLLGGIFYTVQSSSYFMAVKYIPSALAALLLYLNPIFVAILSFFVNREKLSKRIIAAIGISLIGMIFVLGAPAGEVKITGISLAVTAAVVYSMYIVIGNRVTSQVPAIITSAYIALFAAISFFIWGTITRTLHFHFEAIGWLPVVGTALFSSVLAMLTFFAGMNMIGPTKASILSMVEPVITFILSTIFLQEKMSNFQIFGGVIVLVGAILVVMARENRNSNEKTVKATG
jgi:drug/metabolite transporter (DMT)-like permease